MLRIIPVLAVAAGLFGSQAAQHVCAQTTSTGPIHLSTLEWAPFTGGGLAEGGVTTALLRRAFEAAGFEIRVSYMPWTRAVLSAQRGEHELAGYFPGYHCNHAEGFVQSVAMMSSQVGFVENVTRPIEWATIDDLARYRIGTVQGYANTEAFDAAVLAGTLRVTAVRTDSINILRVAHGRIDAAVIDRTVLSFALSSDPELRGFANYLRFNARHLAENSFYLCLRDTPENRRILSAVNVEFAHLDQAAFLDRYMELNR